MPIFSNIAKVAIYSILRSSLKSLTKWLIFQAGVSVASQRYAEIVKMTEGKIISLFMIASMIIFVIFSFFFGTFFLTLSAIFAIGQIDFLTSPFLLLGLFFLSLSLLIGLIAIYKLKHTKLKLYEY